MDIVCIKNSQNNNIQDEGVLLKTTNPST